MTAATRIILARLAMTAFAGDARGSFTSNRFRIGAGLLEDCAGAIRPVTYKEAADDDPETFPLDAALPNDFRSRAKARQFTHPIESSEVPQGAKRFDWRRTARRTKSSSTTRSMRMSKRCHDWVSRRSPKASRLLADSGALAAHNWA